MHNATFAGIRALTLFHRLFIPALLPTAACLPPRTFLFFQLQQQRRFASSAKDRLTGLVSQLASPNVGGGKAALLAQNPNDVVIVAACRTPITRARKGGLKDTCPEELLKIVFEDVVKRAGVDKNLVEEIQVGNVLPPGGGATMARMAQLAGQSPGPTSESRSAIRAADLARFALYASNR